MSDCCLHSYRKLHSQRSILSGSLCPAAPSILAQSMRHRVPFQKKPSWYSHATEPAAVSTFAYSKSEQENRHLRASLS